MDIQTIIRDTLQEKRSGDHEGDENDQENLCTVTTRQPGPPNKISKYGEDHRGDALTAAPLITGSPDRTHKQRVLRHGPALKIQRLTRTYGPR